MWLIESSALKTLERAIKSGSATTAKQEEIYRAGFDAVDSGAHSHLLAIAGDTAQISIVGTLTKKPDYFAMLFGGGNTCYQHIIAALAEAEQNSTVGNIVLAVDSPGGEVGGLFDVIATLQSASKPITATVTGCCASAAYAIASTASAITASNKADRIGSIGIAATFSVYDDDVLMRSSDAPNKNPDVGTEKGKSVIQDELDALHEIFVETIAAGRNTTTENINENYGQGGCLLARDALAAGMIDGIKPALSAAKTEPPPTNSRRISGMDLETLKADHPAVYQAALADGVAQERDRVEAHLTMADSFDAPETAKAAIRQGDGMTAKTMALYNTEARDRKDITARADDDVVADIGAGSGGKLPGASEEIDADKKASDNILRMAAEECGVELEAKHYA